MDAWSSQPIPSEYLRGRTALERRGALVFQAKQCHNCHSLHDKGGQRGPALDSVVSQVEASITAYDPAQILARRHVPQPVQEAPWTTQA